MFFRLFRHHFILRRKIVIEYLLIFPNDLESDLPKILKDLKDISVKEQSAKRLNRPIGPFGYPQLIPTKATFEVVTKVPGDASPCIILTFVDGWRV